MAVFNSLSVGIRLFLWLGDVNCREADSTLNILPNVYVSKEDLLNSPNLRTFSMIEMNGDLKCCPCKLDLFLRISSDTFQS